MGWNMISRLIAIIVLACPVSVWATAYTSTQNGDGSSPATWGGAGIPGNGDTITANHNVTFSVDTTIGSSPSDTTTMAITTATATGAIIIAPGVKLTVRGNITNGSGTSGATKYKGIQLGAGSKIVFDSSQATTTTQRYNIVTGVYSQIYIAGTSDSRASISALPGYGTWTINSGQSTNASIVADYCDFSKTGSASVYAAYLAANTNNGNVSLTHCTFDNSGTWSIAQAAAAAQITFTDNNTANTLAESVSTIFSALSTSTVSHTVTRSIFDKRVHFNPPTKFSISTCYFADIVTAVITNASVPSFDSFVNNYLGQKTPAYGVFEADASNNYFFKDHASANFGIMEWRNRSASRSLLGNIFEHSDVSDGGDLVFTEGFEGRTFTAKNNILLPNSAGGSPGKLLSMLWWYSTGTVVTDGTVNVVGLGTAWTTQGLRPGDAFRVNSNGTWATIESVTDNTHLVLTSGYPAASGAYLIDRGLFTSALIENNTIHTVAQLETGVGVGEIDTGYAGQISSLRNNLFWTKAGQSLGYKLVRQHGTKQDFVTAANADYNWGWNLGTGSEGGGYHAAVAGALFSSGTPDVHGGSGDPWFVDATRSLPLYDTVKLGNPAGTAWASGVNYSVGEIRSAVSSGYYGGATINYRCITAHTGASGNATTGKPGAATTTNWRNNWEFMSLYRLREDLTRISDAISWVKAGFAPTNPALKTAGYGGTYIGAMDVVSLGNPAALLMVQ